MMEQQTTTSIPELAAILLARLGFLWLLVFVSFLLPNDDISFFAFMGVAFIITIPYSLWLRNKLRASQLAPMQFIVDIVLVTGLVYFTGGVQSDLTILYPLVILSAGIVGTPRQATEITILAIVVYMLMGTLLANRMLIEYIPADETVRMRSSNFAIILRGIVFAIFGAASIFVAKRCCHTQTNEKELSETTLSLLAGIPAPTLLLDREGTILFANAAACSALDTEEETLCGKVFKDLCTRNGTPIPKKYGKTTYLTLNKATSLPVCYQTQDFTLPETALPGIDGGSSNPIAVTLLSFTDISGALKTDRQLRKVERITAATRIAGEMAHEIRTPLTAISASVQLLRLYEEKATSADWLPNSPRRKDRQELFDHIAEASGRMNDVVQHFVDFAEFSPADLLSIIKLDSTEENQGYIDHLNTLGREIKHAKNTDSGRRSDDSQLVE